MSEGRPIPTVALGLLALAGLAVGAFFLLFEQVEEERDARPRGEAAANPYFATERLLDRLGVPTTSRYGLGRLPDTDHAVLLLTDLDAQRGPLSERLAAWVAAGGHLVVVPAVPRDDLDLFDLFADLDEPGDDAGGEADTGAPLAPVEPAPADLGDTGLTAADPPAEDQLLQALGVRVADRWTGTADLRVEVDGPRGLTRALRLRAVPTRLTWTEPIVGAGASDDLVVWPAFSAQIDGTLYGAAARQVGAGRVTVLPEGRFLDNDHIDRLDHAPFLLDLLARDGALPAGAVVVLSGDAPSITGLVWRLGWPAVISLFVLLAAWAWRSAVRFGPPLPDPPRHRRSLLEHVEATGHFLWRHRQHGALLAAARRRLRARLSRRHPGLDALDAAAYAEAVADRLDLPPETLRAALAGGEGPDRRAFLTAARALHATWRRA